MTSVELVFPTAEEAGGFWAWDKMHAPRPLHPLSQDLVMTTLSQGFTQAQAEYDCPMVAESKAFHHYFYMSFHPVLDEAEMVDRLSRYEDTLAAKIPHVGKRWEAEWKPKLVKRNYDEKSADYSGMNDAQLLAKLQDMTDWMREMWYIHGHINFVLLAGAAFCDMYDEEFKPSDPTESYQALQGYHTRSVDASRGLWDLSRMAKNTPAIKALFDRYEPHQLAAELNKSAEGQKFRAKLDEFLHEYGWRSDAVYDLADVPWRENPAIPLASIGTFMALEEKDNPEALYQRGVKLREDLMGKARAKLASKPDKLKKFNDLYESAQHSFPITEDHAFYIDQLGVVLFRRFIESVGRRVAEKGCVATAQDVYFLHEHELHEALAKGGDFTGTVAARKRHWEAAAAITPPLALGAPPQLPPGAKPDPFLDAVGVRLLGIKPPSESVDPLVIDGVAGSPGTYTGTARVVRSLLEASDLEEGEVMVCEMTLPPWVPMFSIAGAIVADVGGIMSHCAIVAREFDVPAVVGSVDGTTRIKSGQTVTVDGTAGKVYLDGRKL